MRIVMYELSKICRKKSIIIAILIFSIVNVYKISIDFQKEGRVDNQFNRGYWAAYNRVAGDINNSKVNFVINRYKNATTIVSSGKFSIKPNQPNTYTGYIFGDMNMFGDLYHALDYSYNYQRNIDRVCFKADANIEFYRKRDNAFEVKNNQKIKNLYGGRSITEFYNTEGYTAFLNYDFSSFLIILILVLGLAPIFSGEREVGMNVMLSTCKNGKNVTVFAKIIASMLYVVIISSLFFVLDFVGFSVIYKLFGSSLPIYAMNDFEFTPLTIKIWQFVICSDLIKLLGFLIIGEIIILFSSIFAESLLSFILPIATITLYMACNDFLFGSSSQIVAFINPITLLQNRELFKSYSIINIGGEPVFQYTITLITMMLFFMVMILIIIFINKKDIFISSKKLIDNVKIKVKEMLNA